MKTFVSLCCALLMIVPAVWAQEPDGEGCKDSPMMQQNPTLRLRVASSSNAPSARMARIPRRYP